MLRHGLIHEADEHDGGRQHPEASLLQNGGKTAAVAALRLGFLEVLVFHDPEKCR